MAGPDEVQPELIFMHPLFILLGIRLPVSPDQAEQFALPQGDPLRRGEIADTLTGGEIPLPYQSVQNERNHADRHLKHFREFPLRRHFHRSPVVAEQRPHHIMSDKKAFLHDCRTFDYISIIYLFPKKS